jgi:hypothetical protein
MPPGIGGNSGETSRIDKGRDVDSITITYNRQSPLLWLS